MTKHPPVVYIEWTDTGSVGHLWQDREEALREAASVIKPIAAAGFLLANEKRGVIISLLYNDHNDDVGHTVVIPKFAVRKMRIVRAGKGFRVTK